MKSVFGTFVFCLAAGALAACATETSTPVATAAAEPVVHEYRTGSIIAQKEKRPVTEEEKRRAQEIAAEIRATPKTIATRP
jgi:curli biogenesis system outer membrane secretion channel CsgG